jgi:hypothetical protein
MKSTTYESNLRSYEKSLFCYADLYGIWDRSTHLCRKLQYKI